jgi:hypothetical protein
MAGIVIQPRSVDDYPVEAQMREDLERLRFQSRDHSQGCQCAWCMSVRSFEFMLRGPHPVIHRESCGDCYHLRAGPPLPAVVPGVPR